MEWREFQIFAQKVLSKHFGVSLDERGVRRFPKKFDLVSEDATFVGDAKFLTLVRRYKLAPAKFMEIAGHVWLLEKIPAKKRFLVFGNQRRVSEW